MKDNARIIFANNLQLHLDRSGKTQADLVRDLEYKQPTVSDWVKGKKYPRVDKMQELADYFGVLMSDLTEEKPATPEGDGLTDKQRELHNAIIDLDDADLQKQAIDYVEFLKSKRKQ